MPDTQERTRKRHRIEIVPLEPIMVTVEDAGRLCSLEKSEAYELVAAGIIPAYRFSAKNTRVSVDALRQRMYELCMAGLTPVDALVAARQLRARGRVG